MDLGSRLKLNFYVRNIYSNICFILCCYRTKHELQDWWIMTREQKLEALKKT